MSRVLCLVFCVTCLGNVFCATRFVSRDVMFRVFIVTCRMARVSVTRFVSRFFITFFYHVFSFTCFVPRTHFPMFRCLLIEPRDFQILAPLFVTDNLSNVIFDFLAPVAVVSCVFHQHVSS